MQIRRNSTKKQPIDPINQHKRTASPSYNIPSKPTPKAVQMMCIKIKKKRIASGGGCATFAVQPI